MQNLLIHMYSGYGDIELANKVFVRMLKRDLIL
jgi:pentatricopeptide repeat protein